MKTTTPEKKSAKTLKGQLFGAISMMLVASIALGTSTYAWFINNRTVEVENMQLTVSASTSMLVAVEKYDTTTGTGKGYTGYKSVIVNDDIIGAPGVGADYAGWTNFFKNDMVPASITDANLIVAAPSFFATNNHVAGGKLDEFELVPAADATDGDVTTYGLGQGPVKKLGLRFVSSNDLDVYFSKQAVADTIASLITPAITDEMVNTLKPGENAGGKTYTQAEADASKLQADAIRAALRVSVVAQKSGANTDGTDNTAAYAAVLPHTFQFDAGEPFATTNKNNTEYTVTPTVTADEKIGLYSAISTVDANKHITADGQLKAMVTGDTTATNNAENTLLHVTNGVPAEPGADAVKLFQLTKDTARDVDVFIWLEGTDQDCLNSISGYLFNLKLPFCGVDTPAPVAP